MRQEVAGPEVLEPPYPVVVNTVVTSGFGRGSSELGIPTANIAPDLLNDLEPGVYYGWVAVAASDSKSIPEHPQERKVEYNFGAKLGSDANVAFPMVMSIGWNPYYGNTKKSAEVHILHKFSENFYGCHIRVAVCGYIRPEQSYDSVDALIEDIHTDIRVAERSLQRPAYEDARKLVES